MPDQLDITLETEAPLWTGGARKNEMDRIHATSIIGSLRWWYEAFLRAYGGDACDPTKPHCQFDAKKPDLGLCAACSTFGATGWGRRFRLNVTGETNVSEMPRAVPASGPRFKKRRKPNDPPEHPSWFFTNGQEGIIRLSVVPLAPDFDPTLVLGLLHFISNYAGLAAKTQLGYGTVRIASAAQSFDAKNFLQIIKNAAQERPATGRKLPSVDEMFFARLRAPAATLREADGTLVAALNLKYDLRETLRQRPHDSAELRHFVLGSVQGKRMATKIRMSRADGGIMRVWGWIPNELPEGSKPRNLVLDTLSGAIKTYGSILQWREFNTTRDKVTGNETDFDAYLASLLEGVKNEH